MSSFVRGRAGRGCCVVAAALASIAGIVAASPTASADAGEVGFAGITSDPATGEMNVQVASSTPLSSMTIHLVSGSADVLDLPLSDFTDESVFSPDQTQYYELTDPATALASLPLGSYWAYGDATDTGGDSITGQQISGFALIATTSVTISPTTNFTTYPAEPITLSGQLDIQDPFSTTPSGWGGQTVSITETGKSPDTWTTTTASDGSYTIQVPGTPTDSYQASVAATSGTFGSTSGIAQDLAQYAPAQLTATVSPATAIYGQTQSISGTLSYQSGSQWLPAPAGVTVNVAENGGTKDTSAVTQPGGTFSATLPQVVGTTTWLLSTQQDGDSDPFLQPTQTQANGTLQLPAGISGFTAKLSKYGIVTVTGCLGTTAAGESVNDYPDVEIQFAETSTGPWHDLGSVATSQGLCDGAAIDADGPAPSNYAYYRAVFSGDDVLAPVISSPSLAWLYATRFRSFRVSPHSVASGKKITVSGNLEYYHSHWRAYGHQRVQIIFSKNKKTWEGYGWVTTSRTGTFSKTIADRYGTGYWSVLYYGNNTHLVAGAAIIKVTVHGKQASASLLAPATAGRLGPPVNLLRPAIGARWPAQPSKPQIGTGGPMFAVGETGNTDLVTLEQPQP